MNKTIIKQLNLPSTNFLDYLKKNNNYTLAFSYCRLASFDMRSDVTKRETTQKKTFSTDSFF